MASVKAIQKKIDLPYLLSLIFLLVILKDLLHAYVNDYHFYLDESMLFSSFWLLFFPLLIVYNKYKRHRKSIIHIILDVSIFSIFHWILFALVVSLISLVCFEHTFSFSKTCYYTALDQGIATIIIYSLIGMSQYHSIITNSKNPAQTRAQFKTKKGADIFWVNYSDIIYVKTDRPFIRVKTSQGIFLQNLSLKKFLSEAPSGILMQIHKSTLVNPGSIQSIRSRKNGDYDMKLSSNEIVRASRNYRNSYLHLIKGNS